MIALEPRSARRAARSAPRARRGRAGASSSPGRVPVEVARHRQHQSQLGELRGLYASRRTASSGWPRVTGRDQEGERPAAPSETRYSGEGEALVVAVVDAPRRPPHRRSPGRSAKSCRLHLLGEIAVQVCGSRSTGSPSPWWPAGSRPGRAASSRSSGSRRRSIPSNARSPRLRGAGPCTWAVICPAATRSPAPLRLLLAARAACRSRPAARFCTTGAAAAPPLPAVLHHRGHHDLGILRRCVADEPGVIAVANLDLVLFHVLGVACRPTTWAVPVLPAHPDALRTRERPPVPPRSCTTPSSARRARWRGAPGPPARCRGSPAADPG